jgi:hypothetical protein
MRPKKNGGWDKPFDPREINNNFTEGNSWQYSFFVPQDIPGMIEAYGGNDKFEAKLDEMFNSESKTTGREQVDVTGLIGQYAHGNEPSHHMAYLYNYIGKPEKTTEKVHYILNNFYKNSPDGLIGNEDCGQMSAWYVLSSMGIYNVNPGQPFWTTIQPYFEKIKVNFEDGTSRTIDKSTNDRMFGLNLKEMPNKDYYVSNLSVVPVIEAESKSFKDKMIVEINKNKYSSERLHNPEIFFRIIYNDSIKPNFNSYKNPIEINKTAKIEAYMVDLFEARENKSNIVSATFYKKPNNFTIDIKSKYNPQYHAGGPEGLIDGIFGTENWRKGDWQGYQSQDFEAVIDMQATHKISQITANFLQDTRSWILMPTKVEYYVSEDNVNFTLFDTQNNTIDPKEYKTIIKGFESIQLPIKARYVKVKAINFGKLPEWHQGFPSGGDAFIFLDEITIK